MAVEKIGEMQLDELFASVKSDVHTRVVTVTSSKDLKRGQLIGNDGSANGAFASGNTVVGILCEDLAAEDAATGASVLVYVSGHFNGNKVIGYTADIDAELRGLGMFVDKAITY